MIATTEGNVRVSAFSTPKLLKVNILPGLVYRITVATIQRPKRRGVEQAGQLVGLITRRS